MTSPVPGFVASGVACGIKQSGAPDLALIATADGRPVPAAAVFTTNLAPAAPVQISRAHLAATGGYASAVIVNSGNANAATGAAGREHAERMCALVAEGLGCRPEQVLVCSTGLIGIPLPFDAVVSGIAPLLAARTPEGFPAAAAAMMTTDLSPKDVTARGDGFVVRGIAKGAAMLAPHMATMLALLATDAAATPEELQAALTAGVAESFNALSIDGATSTNDTVIALAGGAAGGRPDLGDLVGGVCAELATLMADGAEGATKRARIRVTGAASSDDARRAARKVAESQLVQCSLYGADPYWGRIVSELGSAGVAFDLDRLSIRYGPVEVCRAGVDAGHAHADAKAALAGREVEITADLGLGDGVAVVTTTDLTPEYIAENMRTS
ncbi:MAG TPA: bifunctional glutamate N-acetyltransferase/amino-acid acetyltransferase ArgJ [Acidimicrobiales bacterium]|nr:bifunctional glutamate N-acetyltransferase/amino-acid acetyltransferase ArgJ [Acidimicrobiales bacterium]